jgi:hypothetical protein
MLSYFTVERIKALLRECESQGIGGWVARADAFIMRVLREYWAEGGAIRWIAQTAPEHADPVRNIGSARDCGASAIYLHGGEVDRLVSSGQEAQATTLIARIRDTGLPAGVAAHVPENHTRLQDLAVPLDFHMVCLYNLTGYRGNRSQTPEETFEPEDRARALAVLGELRRPAIVYKIYGAGRVGPDEAYRDVARSLRSCDGVCVGMFPPDAPDLVGDNVRRAASLPTSRR